jgi:outer membrane protein TolC
LTVCIVTLAAAQEPAEGGKLTLSDAVALAQQTHPSVGVARAGEEAAFAAVGRATSRWWPQLGTQASVMRYDEPMLVAPLHGFGPEQIAQIEFERTLIQGNVSLAWTLYDGGARGARIRGARAEAAGASAGLAATEMGLTTRVAVAYLRVLTARGILDSQDRQIEALSAERRRVEQFLAEGQAAEVELLRVDAALAEAEAGRVAVVAQLDLAERELARLVDLPVAQTRVERLTRVGLAETARPADREQLVERAAANNPELERLRRDVDAAEANHRLAKATWIPRFDVTSGYQAFSSDAGNVSGLWNVGIMLSYPLFTGGERSKTVGLARAGSDAAREQLRLLELQIDNDVDRALNAALETNAMVEALSRAVQHQTEVVRIEQLSLEAGAATQTDYLRAEANLARARSVLVEAEHAEIAAWVELARVAGDLPPAWLDRNVEIVR